MPSNSPSRRPAPAVTPKNRPRSDNGNGEMTVEEAWFIVESAVSQARRMTAAADEATRLYHPDDGD